MDGSIFLQNLDFYFPYHSIFESESIYKTVLSSSLGESEITVCDRIKENIPRYSNYFYIFRNYDQIAFHYGPINKNTFNPSLSVAPGLQQHKSMLLFTYDKIMLIPLYNYFMKIDTTKFFFISIYHSFLHLLQGIHFLIKNDICHFNISSQSIFFEKDLPIFGYWKNSIDIRQLSVSNIFFYVERITEFINQPLEVYVLFYFSKNPTLTTLSCSFIEEITEYYIQHCTVLQFLSESYFNSFKESCITVLHKYINWNKNDIIFDLIRTVHTWDLFSLSYLYLYIVGNFYKYILHNKHDNNFSQLLHNWITILSNNIHPDFTKRESILNTINVCENLTTNTNIIWDFCDTNIGEFLDSFDS